MQFNQLAPKLMRISCYPRLLPSWELFIPSEAFAMEIFFGQPVQLSGLMHSASNMAAQSRVSLYGFGLLKCTPEGSINRPLPHFVELNTSKRNNQAPCPIHTCSAVLRAVRKYTGKSLNLRLYDLCGLPLDQMLFCLPVAFKLPQESHKKICIQCLNSDNGICYILSVWSSSICVPHLQIQT